MITHRMWVNLNCVRLVVCVRERWSGVPGASIHLLVPVNAVYARLGNIVTRQEVRNAALALSTRTVPRLVRARA